MGRLFLGKSFNCRPPGNKTHLQTRVNAKNYHHPHGADAITEASTAVLEQYQLEPGRYFTVIARPEPENSLLEIVQGFSATQRNYKLVVLGNYHAHNAYHQAVKMPPAVRCYLLVPSTINP